MKISLERQLKILNEKFVQRVLEASVEGMYKIGYDLPPVLKAGGKVIIESTEEEELQTTGQEIEEMEGDNIEDMVEDILDAKVSKPKYEYDQDLEVDDPEDIETVGGGGVGTPITWGEHIDMWGAILPQTKVNWDAIEEWVRTVKVRSDPLLGDLIQTEMFDSYVDRVVHKVARKIYYVGRKPKSVTPEEWDDLTRDMRPAEGTYAKGESWGKNVEFPYTREYKYRSGYYGDDA